MLFRASSSNFLKCRIKLGAYMRAHKKNESGDSSSRWDLIQSISREANSVYAPDKILVSTVSEMMRFKMNFVRGAGCAVWCGRAAIICPF